LLFKSGDFCVELLLLLLHKLFCFLHVGWTWVVSFLDDLQLAWGWFLSLSLSLTIHNVSTTQPHLKTL
jgi:hypothetical protein